MWHWWCAYCQGSLSGYSVWKSHGLTSCHCLCRWKMAPVSSHSTLFTSLGVSICLCFPIINTEVCVHLASLLTVLQGRGGQEWGAQLGCAACTGPVPFPALGHSVHITSAPPRFKSKHIHHPFLNPTRIISNGKLPSPVGLVGRSEHPGLQGGSEAPSPVRTAAAEPVPCVPLCSAGMAQI